mgnify:FL=1
MSPADSRAFAPVLAAWRPEHGMPCYLVRWFLTGWCNYDCAYCRQAHRRFGPGGESNHAFDHHSVEEWCGAFGAHFGRRRLSLAISGGEPMLGRDHMVSLINHLSAMPTVECIRIDTNMSWDPRRFTQMERAKLLLNCSYHPHAAPIDAFCDKIEILLEQGYRVGMVNFVLTRDNIGVFREAEKRLNAMGVVLNANPDFQQGGDYSHEQHGLLREELPRADYLYKTRLASPYRKKCLFPAVAYQMDQRGAMNVGCHPDIRGSLFDDELPETFAGPGPCPQKSCGCLDMYSFLGEVNRNTSVDPFAAYCDLLRGDGS